ncbi:MAG: putative rane protein [Patescibacteria group bacterium]|nr:putative rane protein [Patescibacteria group bacterium]
MKQFLRLFFTGFSMGTADIVPGVSGGTIAFILGIYEELIYSIKVMSGECLRLLFVERDLVAAVKKVPFSFLIPLGLGILTAVVTLASLLESLLLHYPTLIWSFFLGLIAASIYIVRKRVVTWDMHDYVALVITAIVAYVLVGLVPVETSSHPLMILASGAIAICAMILPGISGSFLLLIMGKYEQILGAVADRDIMTLGIFMIGAALGISLFSRVLSWLFAKHHDITVAALIGFMIGSLRKVWPWKEVVSTRIDSHGEVVPLIEKNILPNIQDSTFWLALLLVTVGFGVMLLLNKLQVTAEQTKDVTDTSFEKAHTASVTSQKKHKV